MSAMPWPDHLLTLEEWDALPEYESHHVELVEGILLVAPKPAPKHQVAMANLRSSLKEQLPAEVVAVLDVDVLIDAGPPLTVRAPDVVVVSAERYWQHPKRFLPEDLRLAVEIVSPGTRRTDRMFKPMEYAKVGIPHYWLVELDEPITLTAFDLVGGQYKEVARGTAKIEVPSPFPVEVDLTTLINP
ncbi:Uma2 family endonuclease [Actinosynnema sp. NPDC059335]|uniref:Uma2 family endonuclease n=1 Tax=Actinosynnema sp. NPDC059335 TaxID=3346804 RepID=UPI00366FFBB5